jgi:hypothetical protein
MKTTEITIKENEYKPDQLLRVRNVDGTYRINKVTDKAILIECSDGRWTGNGFVPVWLPISQLIVHGVSSNPANSINGIHVVDLPDWLVNANSKKW